MLSNRQYSPDLCDIFSEHPLMDYPAQVRKSANLHIQDGSHGLICIFKIDVNALQLPIFIRSLRNFLCTPSDGLSCLSSKNQQICVIRMAAMG